MRLYPLALFSLVALALPASVHAFPNDACDLSMQAAERRAAQCSAAYLNRYSAPAEWEGLRVSCMARSPQKMIDELWASAGYKDQPEVGLKDCHADLVKELKNELEGAYVKYSSTQAAPQQPPPPPPAAASRLDVMTQQAPASEPIGATLSVLVIFDSFDNCVQRLRELGATVSEVRFPDDKDKEQYCRSVFSRR